ncbi:MULTISPECIES: ACP-like domain-containing protein [unclassified Psychrobacter]|uniref:ACP-like domain-containing protein n=1 Tax=unclassified Psychrobacter TaxID=196806 RepID=UPI003F484757
MKNLTAAVSSAAIMMVALGSGSAIAYSDNVMEPSESYDTAIKHRQVNYTCQNNKKVSVTYGFNKQYLPTFAEANLNGKKRFLPINLGRSDNVGTVFGDEENFSIMTGPLRLNNYHKSSANIQNAKSEILYKGCDVASIVKLKG